MKVEQNVTWATASNS